MRGVTTGMGSSYVEEGFVLIEEIYVPVEEDCSYV